MGLNLAAFKRNNSAKPAKIDEDDEPIVLDRVVPQEDSVKVEASNIGNHSAFVGGFVHPSFNNACSPFAAKTPESSLLSIVISTELAPNEVLVGAISVRSSFIHKTGGSLLI